MSYDYQAERPSLFTENGLEILIAMRDRCRELIRQSGAVSAGKAMENVSGLNWTMLAALDYMVERGELEKLEQPGAWGQHEIYKPGKAWRQS